ncbi:unnamed protein product [Parascedosporium putredinis]|uniref:RING-type domain-containing protein n=1 Tax=Parascedosporium putredinis TaxID=1442378 RepID=A0A9P1GVD7_9PEZI|nr:unnamed protein product [Parascedosporium putredinis]CAI7988041.1 unnamed protein product [Parascedosporium putredinis]
MRPPRLALLVIFFAASSFVFFRSLASLARFSTIPRPLTRTPSRLSGFFTFSSPLALSPERRHQPNRRQQHLLSREASRFRASLPSRGLSGQLWIGSGFADDNLQEGEGEGELGCSDIPGWEDGRTAGAFKGPAKNMASSGRKDAPATGHSRRSRGGVGPMGTYDRDPAVDSASSPPVSEPVDDGTDDYLQHGIPSNSKQRGTPGAAGARHADIQSIQEAAEIAGKIVLLSRGGCGFLEKVKWAQRRGAKALIVGDNRKGGPLIQMSFIEDILDEHGNAAAKVQYSDVAKRQKKNPITKLGEVSFSETVEAPGSNSRRQEQRQQQKKRGWFSTLFGWGNSPTTEGKRGALGSSHDWVLVEDWDDESDQLINHGLNKGVKTDGSRTGGSPGSGNSDGDANSASSGDENGNEAGGSDGKKGGRIISTLFGQDDESDDRSPDVPGLWVTITPSSSTSSFLDTLLVLVISPLITLSVVYALLIVRARIRRRRWRAPKSIVERLPVRTYHAAIPSPIHSPRIPSPTTSSPTTPLLQATPSRSRPRSRTTTGVPESSSFLTPPQVSSEWKKYMSKQVECVVCLEEYVDGVSRVMSLPCGHEFHVDCMYEPYHDSSDEEEADVGTRKMVRVLDELALRHAIPSPSGREAEDPRTR